MPTIEDIFEELEQLKSEIGAAKQEKAEKTGQLSEQMKTLKSFDVNSVSEAKKKILFLKKEAAKLEEEITIAFNELKEKYEW
jgi:predicted  nucleic acid-binding Zn-ribbon protein